MADSSSSTIILRREAIASGLSRYFTGKPCKHGHVSERGTSRGQCLECHREWRQSNRDKINGWRADWRAKRPDLEAAQVARRKERLPHAAREIAKRWREKNPEAAKATRQKSYKKRSNNPKFRLDAAIRAGVSGCIRKGGKNGKKTLDCLGFTREQLVKHLEKKFAPGMNWENYGEWHVDHIIPLKAFNFQTVDDVDFKRAWALSNLQPLWGRENQSKNAKLSAPFQPSLI